MNIHLTKNDTKMIKSLVPVNLEQLVTSKMPFEDADLVRNYLQKASAPNAVINILLYGSKLAKKVNFYNSLIGGRE